MADVHDINTRSYNMSQIKGENTKPEQLVRKYLFANGFRYRKNDKRLPGKPDVVLPKYHAVIFVNGCFWHKHEGCERFVWPNNNSDFWKTKINNNVKRDSEVRKELEDLGWRVITVWECQLSKTKKEETLKELIKHICE